MKTTKISAFVLAVLMSLSCFCISAFAADNEAALDGTTTSKTIEQKYSLTAEEGTKTSVTKVKLTWEIENISLNRKDSKKWNPETLTWDDDGGEVTVVSDGTAKFTLANYSSVKINAKVTFATDFSEPTVTFDETTGTDGKITIDTANGNDAYSTDNLPTGVIVATVKPVEADFADLDKATDEKYGTYTVTIYEYSDKAKTLKIMPTTYQPNFQYRYIGTDIQLTGDTWGEALDGKEIQLKFVVTGGDADGDGELDDDLNKECTYTLVATNIPFGHTIIIGLKGPAGVQGYLFNSDVVDGKTGATFEQYVVNTDSLTDGTYYAYLLSY